MGSDLDLLVIVDQTDEPFERRSLAWDLRELPVPAELIVYTLAEWDSLRNQGGRFVRTLERETVWVCDKKDWRTTEARTRQEMTEGVATEVTEGTEPDKEVIFPSSLCPL